MSTHALRRFRRSIVPLAIGIAALAGMGVFLALAPGPAAAGWLAAFVFWSGIPIGCLAAMMIHALTGGRWGERLAPVFVGTGAALPLMLLLVVPVLALLPDLYPWAGAGPGAHPDVARYYLNSPFFIGRTAIAFAGWIALALVLPRLTGTTAALIGGLGLIFHGFIVGIVGIDWILALQPPFHSTSFGADLAFLQLASAFAWTALLMPPGESAQTRSDLGGLLLATLLGIAYVNFMALLVIWYGDVPSRVFWFVERTRWPWTLLAGFFFIFGSVFPIFSLFLARVRASALGLRVVAGVTLAGIAIFDAYLVVPPFGPLALAAFALSLLAIGAILLAYLVTPWARLSVRRWRSAHVA
jgi:hypothetical protein